MKKLTALLALFLLLVLLSQSACAAAIEHELWYEENKPISQNSSILFGVHSPFPAIPDYEIRLSPIQFNDRLELKASFDSYSKQWDAVLESGYTRKALYVDISLWGRHYTNQIDKYDEIFPGTGYTLNPVIPLSSFIPKGKQFKNLQIFHAQTGNVIKWESIDSVLHKGDPVFDSDANNFKADDSFDTSELSDPTTCASNHNLRLSVEYSFSPFVIVWDELNTGAPLTPPDVPQTGDSAPLAPWLLLLSGACALLALRRRSPRIS